MIIPTLRVGTIDSMRALEAYDTLKPAPQS